MIGLENIPNEGPALLVYYHALLPVDYYYVHAKVFLYKNRRIKIVGDRFLFLIPGTKFFIYLKKNSLETHLIAIQYQDLDRY